MSKHRDDHVKSHKTILKPVQLRDLFLQVKAIICTDQEVNECVKTCEASGVSSYVITDLGVYASIWNGTNEQEMLVYFTWEKLATALE